MKKLNIIVSIAMILAAFELGAQTLWPEINRYRNDELGSQKNRKKDAVMDGNRISTLFYNNGEIAQWPYSPSGLWPKGPSGLNYIDGICLLIMAEAPTNKGKFVHPLETYYRERLDVPGTFPGVPSALTEEPLGFTPVGGYFAATSTTPAMSNSEKSWPGIWPSALFDPATQNQSDYSGQWLGYFGRNIFNADLETFFVMDDSKDFEFTYPFPINRGRYYPIKENIPPANATVTISVYPDSASIILIKSGGAVDAVPVDFTEYTASDEFGKGSEIGNGNYVVYSGNSKTSLSVSKLVEGTTYHYATFKFGGSGTSTDYNTKAVKTGTLTPAVALATELKQYFNPEIRKGLGLRVETRGFQWSNVLAEDIMFWHYDIFNLSDFDYSKTYFGFYTDTGLGGNTDNGDDNAGYDKVLDITYGYDKDGKVPGRPELKLGIYGLAYLESPGNFSNGLNDDEDSTKSTIRIPMIDERRNDGLDNDKDWVTFIDINGNGIWDWNSVTQTGEPLNDDVGADGAGPFDEPYDPITKKSKPHTPDFGEGDGLPTEGEPNFDSKDKDESDQIGLTAVKIADLTGTDIWPENDDKYWEIMSSNVFDTKVQNTNIQIVFSSGPFPLNGGLNSVTYGRERFSMAVVFATDVPDLIFKKYIIQVIYDANYNFTKPPIKPILTAIPGDGKVYLSWDSRAEDSRDPLLGYEKGRPELGPKKDFEGYAIYRSTEPSFDDVKLITDSQGEKKYYRPLPNAQWDKVDGIKGPDPIGINGARYWRGSDTGLQHSFIDEDVINGMTYYYTVVSYDEGVAADTAKLKFTPSECAKIIRTSTSGAVTFVDINCAVVTPQRETPGYEAPQFKVTNKAVFGTGTVSVSTINRDEIKEGSKYKLIIKSSGVAPVDTTIGALVVRNNFATAKIDTIGEIALSEIGENKFSSPIDGMIISINNDVESGVIDSATAWVGNPPDRPNLIAVKTPDADLSSYKPRAGRFDSDYIIEFFDTYVGNSYAKPLGDPNKPVSNPQTLAIDNIKAIPVKFKIKNINTGKYIKFYTQLSDIKQNDIRFGHGDKIILADTVTIFDEAYVLTKKEIWPWIVFYGYTGADSLKAANVTAGDKFKIKTRHIFLQGDEIEFSATAQKFNATTAKSRLNDIKVVPNPYIATAIWEQAPAVSSGGRGERKIYFTNLPPECKIKIFTVSGTLVRELQKSNSITDSSLPWDLLKMDGMDVAYGLYVFHVDAPGIGEHIGRFVLIK